MKSCGFCVSIARSEYLRPVGQESVLFQPRTGGIGPNHYLLVPRTHVERFDTNPIVTAMVMRDAAFVAPELFEHYNVIVNSGTPAGQTAFHLHVHILGREEGDEVIMPWPHPGKAGV